MRRHPILLIATLGTLATLAACGSKEPPAAEGPAATAPETTAAAQEPVVTSTPPVEVVPPPPAPAPAAAKPASKPATGMASKPAPKPAPVPVNLTVPAGTILALSATTPVTSKTAKVGDPVAAQVTEAVTADGAVAIPAGSTVTGQVVRVVSGSDKIGGKPVLVVAFDRLDLPSGKSVVISGEVTQEGKSDTAGDTAKIVGGAAAGAIIGGQVKSGDKGKVIGGLLGAAAGTIAAKETGTEARIKEGAALSVALAGDISVPK